MSPDMCSCVIFILALCTAEVPFGLVKPYSSRAAFKQSFRCAAIVLILLSQWTVWLLCKSGLLIDKSLLSEPQVVQCIGEFSRC